MMDRPSHRLTPESILEALCVWGCEFVAGSRRTGTGTALRVLVVCWCLLFAAAIAVPQARAAAWRVVPAATQQFGAARLTAVSCASPVWCRAVGVSSGSSLGDSRTVGETWMGHRSLVQVLPRSRGGLTSGYPVGPAEISCPKVDWCAVVASEGAGSTAAYVWARRWGSRQRLPPAPAPPEFFSVDVVMTGVSCSSAVACVAIGTARYTSTAGGSENPPPYTRVVVDRFDGARWSAVRPPFGAGRLASLSCVSTTWCVAVGSNAHAEPFAASWNGHGWSRQRVALPAGGPNRASFTSVSCTSRVACIAVGSASVGASSQLAEAWNGKRWLHQPVVAVGAGSPGFAAVSCSSHRMCAAAGADYVERWDGVRWALHRVAPPREGAASLGAVSCPSVSMCAAVGEVAGQELPLTEILSRGRWTPQVTFTPAAPTATGNPYGDEAAVYSAASCSAVGACETVGAITTAASCCFTPTVPVGAAWNGRQWALQRIETPGVTPSLGAVSCTTVESCTAVGSYTTSESTTNTPLVMHWNGATWSTQPLPLPRAGPPGMLTGVSCPQPTACMAVGVAAADGRQRPIAERWNGSRWSSVSIPDLTPAENFVPLSVSCSSPTACTAVGYAGPQPFGGGVPLPSNLPGPTRAIVLRWNGSAWQNQSFPTPMESSASVLESVSCPTNTTCVAVGTSAPSPQGPPRAVTATWAGTGWTMTSSPVQYAGMSVGLSSVSCATPTACEAVGSADYPDSSSGVVLQDAWDGNMWTLQSATADVVSANQRDPVSCGSTTFCLAIWLTSGGGLSPLVELYT